MLKNKKISSYLVNDVKEKCMIQRYSQIYKVSIEASEVSGVQGLDPKENFQPFIWLGSVKDVLIRAWDPRDLACLS